MKQWFIPSLLLIFSLISLATLKSIAPDLAQVQLKFWILGAVVFFISLKINWPTLKKYNWVFYVSLCLLLVITLIIGKVTRGTARWIKIGDWPAIQGSQLAVPVVAITAGIFASKIKLDKFKNIFKFLGVVLLPGVLILIAPDLGTTLVYLLSLGAILFFSKIKLSQLLTLITAGLLIITWSWFFVLKDYQKQRIYSFISPTQESSYNARQALIAVGSGKSFGKGLGFGSQSHLKFLPERQTDFIFASFAEEWGFGGSMILLILYISLISFLLYYAYISKNKAHAYFLLTSAIFLSIQTLINIGMNIGLLPITGVTLPLVSYGGSSLLSICLMLGIAHNLILKTQHHKTLHLK